VDESGERISGIHVLGNKIYSVSRTKTKYLLAEIAITLTGYENSCGGGDK
jgi:hypothetical protein